MDLNKSYTEINSKAFDNWNKEGWEWGIPVSHEVFEDAKKGKWDVVLTPTKPVPKEWFPNMKGCRILGLASGGGQQMPVFSALGARCTVLDYSESQLESERVVAKREGYDIEIVRADMTKPLPFQDESFDMIFHPVSNSYIEKIRPLWRECYRVLKKGGVLMAGLDNGFNYLVNDEETEIVRGLPFNPLKDQELFELSKANDWGVQFSHTAQEQLREQLLEGFVIKDIFEDTNGSGRLHDLNIPTFWATLAVKN